MLTDIVVSLRRASVTPVEVSADAARRFLAARHLLAPARTVTGGPEAVLEVFRRLGSIQFDPLSVAGRNHDLVLHARVAGYDPAWCEELLYVRRELFEAYNKGLSLLPTSELPWYRVSWRLNAPRFEQGILAENVDVATEILERIRTEGTLSTLDFERGPAVEWFWAPTNVARAVLEAYSVSGVLGLSRREGNRRVYDLIERLFPAELLAHDVDVHEQLRHKLLSRFRAHGLLGKSGSGELWLGIGKAKPDPKRPELPSRTELREELVAAGDLVAVDVEGVRGERFVLREEVELLQSPPEPPPSVAFLAPLDPLMWDRDLLRPLYGFDYVWEVYVPEAKRRWGYYVLPIFFRDRLVGRFEPRIDRAGRSVQVLALWWEDGFAPRRADGFVDAMRDALRAYLGFAGASRVEWAPHLAKEKRLFGARP
jgi:uncharacterized protein YcaQ